MSGSVESAALRDELFAYANQLRHMETQAGFAGKDTSVRVKDPDFLAKLLVRAGAALEARRVAELEAENARLADDLDLARDCLKRGDASDAEHARLREAARRVCDYAGNWQGEDAFANLLDDLEAAISRPTAPATEQEEG